MFSNQGSTEIIARPILQITDALVNGSGLSRKLYEDDGTHPKVLTMIDSMLEETEVFPLDVLLHSDHSNCDAACYRCLLRYENQPFHGLLDWRLGLTYLRALVDSEFSCGLNGNFEHHGLSDWGKQAALYAEQMAKRFDGEVRLFANNSISGFKLRNNDSWVLVAHPLWEWDGVSGPPRRNAFRTGVRRGGYIGRARVLCWDTFQSCATTSTSKDKNPRVHALMQRFSDVLPPPLEEVSLPAYLTPSGISRIRECPLSVLHRLPEDEQLPPTPLAVLGSVLHEVTAIMGKSESDTDFENIFATKLADYENSLAARIDTSFMGSVARSHWTVGVEQTSW